MLGPCCRLTTSRDRGHEFLMMNWWSPVPLPCVPVIATVINAINVVMYLHRSTTKHNGVQQSMDMIHIRIWMLVNGHVHCANGLGIVGRPSWFYKFQLNRPKCANVCCYFIRYRLYG